MLEAEMGVLHLQIDKPTNAKDCQQHQKLGGGKEWSPEPPEI